MVAVAIGGAALLGAGSSIYGANKSADAQKKAAAQATAAQQAQYQQTRGDLSPFRNAGASAVKQYSDLIGNNGADARNAAFANYQTDPAYEWQRNEAIKGVQGSAAARGSLFSGNTLRAISDRTQAIANTDYSNYLSRLANMSNLGENAAAQTGAFGQNTANNISNNYLTAGNATAGAYINGANSFNNLLGQGAQAYGAYQGGAFGGNNYSQYLNQTAQGILG